MWQSSSTGKVNGISGNVDTDIAYKDYPTIIKAAKLNGFGSSAQKPTVTTKTVEELAKEVIAGKWGNGAARKTALTNAGYDYSTVQAKVNELMSGKSVDELAREVIAGKWGNGNERKKKLTAAGYDYSKVQARVNQLLK